MAEASQALEQMEQQMQEQELRHQQQIRRMEESMDSMGHSSQMLLNAQASSKQDQLFFQPDKDDFLNNNESINKRVGLEALEEVEEVSDVENKCEQHLKRIQELEVSNASSQASLNEVSIIIKNLSYHLWYVGFTIWSVLIEEELHPLITYSVAMYFVAIL